MIPRAPLALATLLFTYAPQVQAADKAACIQAAEEGQSLRDGKELGAAREKFLVCAHEECPSVVRDDCISWLADVEARRPSLVFSAKDGAGNDLTEVKVSIGDKVLATRLDGKAIELDPGEYVVKLEAGGRTIDKTVVVAEGQKSRTVDVVFDDPKAPPKGPETERSLAAPAWACLGVGGAGLVAFAVLQGIAQSEYADLEEGCGSTKSCSDDDLAPTEAKFIASGAMLGVGGAGLVTAVVLFIVDATATPSSDVGVSVELAPDRAFFRIAFPIGG